MGLAMTENTQEQNETADLASVPAVTVEVATATETVAGDGQVQRSADGEGSPARKRRRGGKKRQRDAAEAEAAAPAKPAQEPVQRSTHPLLEQLAQWHPALFGEQLLPFKRGIYEDLLEAHPFLDKEALKLALQQHTRSTRYLSAMASGQQRHDLNGLPVEAALPEHVHHALIEVFRRRQRRSSEDLQPKLRNRIVVAYEASGLTREQYAERVQGRDEKANALVAEALAEADARAAKDEALLRSFELSGQGSEQAFAEMYGLNPRQVAQQLERAHRRKTLRQTQS